MSHCGQLSLCTLQGFLREQVAWFCPQLASYYFLVDTVVAVDAHLVDVGLLSLHDSHLEVYGVADDVHLCRVEAVEDVSVVPVHVSDGILVLAEAFVYELLVIHVALLHTENGRQLVGVIHCVAHPFDVADIVFLSLVDLYINVDVLVVVWRDAVGDDYCVTVSQLVVFVYEVLLVGLVSLWCVLLCLEERVELSSLICF